MDKVDPREIAPEQAKRGKGVNTGDVGTTRALGDTTYSGAHREGDSSEPQIEGTRVLQTGTSEFQAAAVPGETELCQGQREGCPCLY